MIKVDSVVAAKELAKLVSGSTYIGKNTYSKVEDIFCAIVAGTEMGIPPLTALREFHNIQGKWEISGTLMLGLAINRGAIPQWEETSAERAVLLLRRFGVTHRHEFSMQDAHRAGLTKRQVWKQYPAAMLRARCASAAVRCFCPDAVLGGVYVHGEVSGETEREEEMAEEMSKDMAEELTEVIERRQPMPSPDKEELSPGQEEELAYFVEKIDSAQTREELRAIGKEIGDRASQSVKTTCEIAYSVRLGELAA